MKHDYQEITPAMLEDATTMAEVYRRLFGLLKAGESATLITQHNEWRERSEIANIPASLALSDGWCERTTRLFRQCPPNTESGIIIHPASKGEFQPFLVPVRHFADKSHN